MTRFAISLAAVLLLAHSGGMAQQTADPPFSGERISGRVVSANTGAPLAGATVEVTPTRPGPTSTPSWSKTARSDDDGRFEFTDIPAGDVSLRVSRPGYYFTGPRRFESADGIQHVSLQQRRAVVTLAMHRGGAIAGRVFDEFGEPVANAQVNALRYEYGVDGVRAASTVGVGDLTDDLGQFRVYGLPPGNFTVAASGGSPGRGSQVSVAPGGQVMGFLIVSAPGASPPTYFPGTLSAGEAQLVSLAPGQDASVQFTLMKGRVVRVSGRAVMSNGAPAAGMMATMWSRTGSVAPARPQRIGADGAFVFQGVAPGDYWVNVNNRAGGTGESASIPVAVGTDDVSDLSIATRRGATIRGTVVFDGRRPPGSPFGISVPLVDGMRGPYGPFGSGGSLRVGNDGRFEARDIFGRVTFSSMDDDWAVISATVGGVDVLDAGLDLAGRSVVDGIRITVSNRLASVSGRAADDKAQPLAEHLVVLLREDGVPGGARSIRALRTDAGGRFDVNKLRPGSYVAGVVDDLEPGYHFSPEFQGRLRERGKRFTLGDGAAVRLDLTLTPGLR